MFQKRHYDFLAAFMAAQRPHCDLAEWHFWQESVSEALAKEAERSGVNFKPELFRRACDA